MSVTLWGTLPLFDLKGVLGVGACTVVPFRVANIKVGPAASG